MELRLWGIFMSRADVRQLSPEARMFLIELGVTAANIEHLDIPDGFVPESAVLYMGWPYEQAIQHMEAFKCVSSPAAEVESEAVWLAVL